MKSLLNCAILVYFYLRFFIIFYFQFFFYNSPLFLIFIQVCGPPGFMVAMSGNKTKEGKQGELDGLLKAAGYTEDMVFKF